MGGAIVAGLLASNRAPALDFSAETITVVNPGAQRRDFLAQEYGVNCIASIDQVETAGVVIFAVKPQVMDEALGQFNANAHLTAQTSDMLFVSIAAGLTTAWIEERLPEGAHVVRVMPNMPLMVGSGASGVCAGKFATDPEARYVTDLFGCMGEAALVAEDVMDAVCALSGSGPAYVALMIEALRDAAVDQGMDCDLAQRLAVATVLGTARYIDETGISPEDTRISICSPGGTTLAALDAMGDAGFVESLHAGVDAAVRRSKELASC